MAPSPGSPAESHTPALLHTHVSAAFGGLGLTVGNEGAAVLLTPVYLFRSCPLLTSNTESALLKFLSPLSLPSYLNFSVTL